MHRASRLPRVHCRSAIVWLAAGALATAAAQAATALQDGYVRAEVCRDCHRQVYDTYKQTPMGRSFYRSDSSDVIEDWDTDNRYYHEPSNRHYEMSRRGDSFFIARYQLDKQGRHVNSIEKQVTHVMGSGEMVRIYMHQDPDGRIFELPVAWYAQEKRWGMPPGYDQPTHYGFTRTVNHKCMFCHNGYPAVESGADRNRWGDNIRFTGWIPMGIDCQRCHGPGARHVEAARAGDPAALRGSIVNPANLSTEGRFEVCMQCHMETTLFFLPESYRRFDRPIYSYRPGEPLTDYIIHFDHPPGTGYDDKFNIGSSAYRLRKSVCFQKSGEALICTTCHNPHDRPRLEGRTAHYRSRCFTCHSDAAATAHTMTKAAFMQADCVDCHMPRRRAEDAIHTAVTDHMIQRFRPGRDLLAPRKEKAYEEQLYSGTVDIYLPKTRLEGVERDLYWGIAQVKDGANLAQGVEVLRRTLASNGVEFREPYYELAEALVRSNQPKEAAENYRKALRLDPAFIQAHNNLGLLLAKEGKFDEAIEHYRAALAIDPRAADVHNNFGIALLGKQAYEAAAQAFQNAVAANPLFHLAHLNLGKRFFLEGKIADAKAAFERTLTIEPAQAEAHGNLGLVLLGLGAYGEAVEHLTYAYEKGGEDVKESARKALELLRSSSREASVQEKEKPGEP